MSDLLYLGRTARRASLSLVCLALLGYLGYHAFVGERGIFTHWRLEDETRVLQARLDALASEHEKLEHRIALMNAENPDPDMLDERVRAVLNFARPDEITIMRRTD